MKGIVLAGGRGTRMGLLTKVCSKQLLPVYDKPLINYPLSILMLGGLRDILVVSTPRDTPMIQDYLGDGSEFGIRLSYKVQTEPRGIADVFRIAEEFIDGDNVALTLGDNIFFAQGLGDLLCSAFEHRKGAHLFAYHVNNPQAYGVVEFDDSNKPIALVEKPKFPASNWALTGLYVYDEKVVRFAHELHPSGRGELEITDINKRYLEAGELEITLLGRGTAWFDAGTPDSLLEASHFIRTIQVRQRVQIGDLEEVARVRGFISPEASPQERAVGGA